MSFFYSKSRKVLPAGRRYFICSPFRGRSSIRSSMTLSKIGLSEIGRKLPRRHTTLVSNLENLFTGFHPRIHDKNLKPLDWLRNYYQTYIESRT